MIKSLIKGNKGLTLVELIVALSITSIITSAIVAFLVSNLNSFSTASDLTEIQHQAQFGLNGLSDDIRGAEGVVKLIDTSGVDTITTMTEQSISAAVFRKGSEYVGVQRDINAEGIPILKINKSMTTVNDSINEEFITYLEELKMKPLQDSFSNCNAVLITMTFKKNDAEITVTNEVYFRNK